MRRCVEFAKQACSEQAFFAEGSDGVFSGDDVDGGVVFEQAACDAEADRTCAID